MTLSSSQRLPAAKSTTYVANCRRRSEPSEGALRDHASASARSIAFMGVAATGREQGMNVDGSIAIHVTTRAQVPLVLPGVPVLQPLGVREHVAALLRSQPVLLEQQRQLGDRRGLEPVQSRRDELADAIGRLLRVTAEEALDHKHAVVDFTLVLGFALIGEYVVAQVNAVGERVLEHAQRAGQRDTAGSSTPMACSTRSADHGAPPTRRRISMYSMGFGTRPSLMLASPQTQS